MANQPHIFYGVRSSLYSPIAIDLSPDMGHAFIEQRDESIVANRGELDAILGIMNRIAKNPNETPNESGSINVSSSITISKGSSDSSLWMMSQDDDCILFASDDAPFLARIIERTLNSHKAGK